MTVLYYEPDPVHKKVMEAWLCTNMMPKTAGEVTGQRDMTSPGQTRDYNIGFTAITQHGYGVRRLAQRLLDAYNLSGMNSNLQEAAFRDVSADVKRHETGYGDMLAQLNRNKVA